MDFMNIDIRMKNILYKPFFFILALVLSFWRGLKDWYSCYFSLVFYFGHLENSPLFSFLRKALTYQFTDFAGIRETVERRYE